jgi:hypothetical protein
LGGHFEVDGIFAAKAYAVLQAIKIGCNLNNPKIIFEKDVVNVVFALKRYSFAEDCRGKEFV